VSFGHIDKIAGLATGTPAASGEKSAPPVDPLGPAPCWTRLYDRPDVRAILAVHDIDDLFRGSRTMPG